jgi:polyhydroxyalkanoate synthesis repressor PhaR
LPKFRIIQAMADKERIITKYASRRLYDTFESEYIAFKDLQNLIAKGIPLKIIDAKTKEDVTRSVMVSLVLENTELFSQFSNDFLIKIICLYKYNEEQREMFGNYIQKSLDAFMGSNTKFLNPLSSDAMDYLSDLGKEHQMLTEKFMNELLKFGKQS